MNLRKRARTRAELEKDHTTMWTSLLAGSALVPVMCSLPVTVVMIIIGGTLGGGLAVAWVLEQIFRTDR